MTGNIRLDKDGFRISDYDVQIFDGTSYGVVFSIEFHDDPSEMRRHRRARNRGGGGGSGGGGGASHDRSTVTGRTRHAVNMSDVLGIAKLSWPGDTYQIQRSDREPCGFNDVNCMTWMGQIQISILTNRGEL